MKNTGFPINLILAIFLLSSFNILSKNQVSETENRTNGKSEKARKIALILANGTYDKNKTNWPPIASLNDVPLVKTALEKQGFNSENIKVLTDANKEQMTSALKDLIETANTGDIVVVHYSGHGQQILDNNNDEIDGLDETLVPINAPARSFRIPDYKYQYHLRDDEFGHYLNILRQRVGKNGHVLVLLDSCYSGSATRGGLNNSRGGQPPLIIQGSMPEKILMEKGSGYFEENIFRGNPNDLGRFIVITATRANERNYETTDANGNTFGSLSMGLSQVLNKIEPGETYRSLFSKLQSAMYDCAPYQTPTIEGDIDAEFLGGSENYLLQTPYFNIINIINENQIEIDGGFVHNLTEGTKVGLYKIGTKSPIESPQNLLYDGIINEIGSFHAKVTCNKNLNLENIKSAWVFVTELGVSAYKLRVNLDGLSDRLIGEIERNISTNPLIIESQTNFDYKITEKVLNKSIENPTLIFKGSDIQFDVDMSDLKEKLSGIARVEFLKKIKIQDHDYPLEVEFIPVILDNNDNETERKNIDDYTNNGTIELPLNTHFKLKIKNKGHSNCYFNIIDIQPDGKINSVMPNNAKNLTSEDCFVKAGQEIELTKYFIIARPTGNEIFKVFVTPEPLNLEPIVSSFGSRGSEGRGANMLNGFEEILSEAYGTRGGPGNPIYISEGSVYNIVFKIVD